MDVRDPWASRAARALPTAMRYGLAEQRSGGISIAVARAFDESGTLIAETRVDGPTPYELTADLLAWAAAKLATARPESAGALGPADAFGLEALIDGCRGVGLEQVGSK